MGNCNRAAFLDLLAETGDHRAVGSQNISEAGGHKSSATLYFATLNGQTQRLNVNLGDAFGTAHHIGRVHCLVGGNHHHFLHIVFNAFICDSVSAMYIDTDGLTRVLLHERDMLVCGCMEHNLRAIGTERKVHARALPNISDDRNKGQIREFLLQFQPDVVHRGLCVIEKYQFLDIEACELTAEFRPYRAGRTCNHDHFILEIFPDGIHGDSDFLTAEQILDLHITDGIMHHPPCNLINIRDDKRFNVQIETLLHQTVAFLLGIHFRSEQDSIHIIVVDFLFELYVIIIAEYGKICQQQIGRLCFLREETNHFVVGGVLKTHDSSH